MGDWGALAVKTSRESDPEDGLMLGLTRLSGFMHKYMSLIRRITQIHAFIL